MAGNPAGSSVVAVFGSGSFGTALATLIARNGTHAVRMLTRRREVGEGINEKHVNVTHLSEFALPDNIEAYTDPEECLRGAEFIVHAIPVQSSFAFIREVARFIEPGVPVVSASKGICSETLRMMHEIIPAALERPDHPTAFVSGPTFARELMNGSPSGMVLASASDDVAKACSALFASPLVRVYLSGDVIGVEVGGALKNVFALAAGIADGMGWGMNTTALLVTLGCREMGQVADAMGAKTATLSGLSGVGDMMLTAFGAQSRNRSVGRRLGEGAKLADILEERGSTLAGVAEGVATAPAALRLARSHGVDVPIIAAVCAVLRGAEPSDALATLLLRPVRANGDLVVPE